jgi:hypothetical protein
MHDLREIRVLDSLETQILFSTSTTEGMQNRYPAFEANPLAVTIAGRRWPETLTPSPAGQTFAAAAPSAAESADEPRLKE